MPRHLLPLGLAALLLAAVLAVFLVPAYVGGQALPIRGTTVTQSGTWNIGHIGGTLHVSGIIRGFGLQGSPVTVTGTALDVNCTGCAAATVVEVDHVSSVLHVQVSGAGTPTSSMPVRCVNTAGTAFEACGGAGAAADSVNVFHQSTIRHISSLTHMVIVDWQRWAHLQASQSGSWIVTASHIANMPSMAQGGVWTIQAAHQGGEWNLRHVTSVTHVVGALSLVARDGTYAAFTSTSLNVNVTNAVAVSQSGEWNLRHVSGVVHVAGAVTLSGGHSLVVAHISSVLHIQVAGTGIPGASLSVRCVNTGGTAFADCGGAGGSGDAVNVFHQSTIRHISSVTHVAGGISLVSQAGTYAAFTSTSLDVNVANATLAVTQSGTWTVQPGNTVNTSPWLVNIGHISGQIHARLIANPTDVLAVHATQTGTWTAQPGNTPNTTAWLVNVQHVSSQLHINLASVGGLPIPTSQGLPIQHVASVVHIAVSGLGTPTQAISVRCVNTGATAFADCGGAGGSADAVNVFHQSTVRHISSLTHVVIVDWQRWAHVQVSQSGSWSLQATHQGGEWNVRHVSSVTHVSGNLAQIAGVTIPFGAGLPVGHISSVLHIQVSGAGTPTSSLPVRCVNTAGTAFADCGGAGGSSDAVNVFHQSTIRHVSSVTHVVLVATGHANVMRQHISSAFRAWRVANCGTTARTVASTNPDRRDLYLQNLGGPAASGSAHYNIYLGYGLQGHVALTINNGWVLHAMGYLGAGTTPSTGPTTQLILYNYQGPLACISATATGGGPQLSILEVLR